MALFPAMLDFKTKARPSFTAALNESKNPKFLAINHNAVSFEKDTYKGNKKIPTRLTLIRALAPGWGSAPYKQSQKTARPQRRGSRKEMVHFPGLRLKTAAHLGESGGFQLADTLFGVLSPVLRAEFAEPAPSLTATSASTYHCWSSGRRNCRGALVKLQLFKREDLVSHLLRLVYPTMALRGGIRLIFFDPL
jgi:hypothetical protein